MTTEATTANEGDTAKTEATTVAAVEGTAPEAVVAGAETAAAAASATTTTGVRPEGLGDEFWDDATGLKVGDLASAYRDLKAASDARLADVPAADAAYDLALPADFKVPEGFEVEIKTDDPLWADFQSIARDAGLPKGEFSKFIGAFAKYQIAAQQADVDAYVAEMSKLGENATPRRDAADAWLKANLKAEQASALGGAVLTAAGIQAIEALIGLKSGPTAATGVGATGVSKFDGLRGGDMLDAIRSQKAA